MSDLYKQTHDSAGNEYGKLRPTQGVQVPLGNRTENAGDRIMRSLDNRITGEPKPTRKQVAMVLHTLADHTAIMSAVEHRPDATSPWPQATSIGRWFHDVADDLEDRFGGGL